MSCDKIEGPYIKYDESVATTVVFPDLDTAAVYKKILIEEYTGHRCTNCPDGHRTLEGLSQQYGDTLIAIGIHAGTFAKPQANKGFPADYRTDEGTEMYTDFAVGATPRAVINRAQFNGTYGQDISAWGQIINNVNHAPAVAAIQIINKMEGNTLTAHTKTTFLQDYYFPVKLALYVIEDGIVSPQIDGGDTIADYTHNHVLRKSLNGTYGAYFSENGQVAAKMSYTKSYKTECPAEWNKQNCYIVAILMDEITREVLQVEKCAFVNE